MIQCYCLKKQRGLSQEQLGAEIGVTRQTVSKWELGETTPEMDKLIQLGSLFGITLDELVGNETENATFTNYMEQNRRNRGHYEYKSKRTVRGIPLVHINVGHGMYKARGIIAIGNIARGVISLGVISAGILSLGAISAGLISFGALSLGILLSLGAISVGAIAVGGVAFGLFAIGGCAFGLYAIGGCAIAEKIAGGGYANASVAIGDKVKGDYTFYIKEPISSEAIKTAILRQYPKTWSVIVEIFQSLFGSL